MQAIQTNSACGRIFLPSLKQPGPFPWLQTAVSSAGISAEERSRLPRAGAARRYPLRSDHQRATRLTRRELHMTAEIGAALREFPALQLAKQTLLALTDSPRKSGGRRTGEQRPGATEIFTDTPGMKYGKLE